jgi:hypothetical protein
MKLSPDQLETIRQNLIASGIKYQDVLDELLDHYATGIEARLAAGESFGEAYAAIQDGFRKVKGRWWEPNIQPGLEAFQQQYLRNASRHARRAQWQMIRGYFRGWNLLGTAALGVLIWVLCQSLTDPAARKWLVTGAMLLCLVPMVLFVASYFWKMRRARYRFARLDATLTLGIFSLNLYNLLFQVPRLLLDKPAFLTRPGYLFIFVSLSVLLSVSHVQTYRHQARSLLS